MRIDGQILGPSFAIKLRKWGFGITTKANIKFDLEAALEILESASVIVESPDGPEEYDEMIQNDLLSICFTIIMQVP